MEEEKTNSTTGQVRKSGGETAKEAGQIAGKFERRGTGRLLGWRETSENI